MASVTVHVRPSMGPQHVRCGMDRTFCVCDDSSSPSMGPQHVRCGMNADLDKGRIRLLTLQWGRNMFVAECPAIKPLIPIFANSLQWGRNMFVAECRRGIMAKLPMCDPSMGPQHVRCGMRRASAGSRGCSGSFNGAATCSLRNDNWNNHPLLTSYILQWGRNMFVAE